MVDLETVGLSDDSAIAQIGAVFYDDVTYDILAEFSQNVNFMTMVKTGVFTKDKETLDWWKLQNKDVRESVFLNPMQPKDSAKLFIDWVQNSTQGKNFTLISNHILFDIVKLNNFLSYYANDRIVNHTKYNMIEDFATIRNKAKWLDEDLLKEIEEEFEGQLQHNALSDCKWQVHSLQACMEIISAGLPDDICY